MTEALKRFKRFLRRVKQKFLNSRANVQQEPVQERSDPGVVDNVSAARLSGESIPTANHVTRTMPERLSVNVNIDLVPSPTSSASAQDHHDRSSLTIDISPQHGISPPRQAAIATTHYLHSLHTPWEGIVPHVPYSHQRTVMVMTDNDTSPPSDLGSNMYQHGNLRSLSMNNPLPCQCSHVRGSGSTGRPVFEVIPEMYSEDPLYHHATSPAHDLHGNSSALHSTGGRWLAPFMTPHSPPLWVLPPIPQHDAHSYLDVREPLHSNPSPLIWVVPPQVGGAHPGLSYTSPAASHQLQSTCGCDACSRLLRANDVGSSRTLPRHSSRLYSTGSSRSHFGLASPGPTRSHSVLVGHTPSGASPSTIVTPSSSLPPVPSTMRSDTPPSRRGDNETTAEMDCEKLPVLE